MKRNSSAILLIAALGALGFASQPLLADDDSADAARLSKAGEILPLEKILERARAEHPGKVLETELEHKHGRYVYEVELLDEQGVVWEVKLDAKTGAVIKSKRDD